MPHPPYLEQAGEEDARFPPPSFPPPPLRHSLQSTTCAMTQTYSPINQQGPYRKPQSKETSPVRGGLIVYPISAPFTRSETQSSFGQSGCLSHTNTRAAQKHSTHSNWLYPYNIRRNAPMFPPYPLPHTPFLRPQHP